MRGLLFVVASIALTVLSWGLYGPVLHEGQANMSLVDGSYARLRPFVCVGLAYFAIGVVVPLILLKTRGEKGAWTSQGTILSLAAGALGAVGALGIIMAFTFGGRPSFVMPLVFGGAPVVNAFLTVYMAKKFKEIGPLFIAGLMMVVMGAVAVLVFKPAPVKKSADKAVAAAPAEADSEVQPIEQAAVAAIETAGSSAANFGLQLLSIASVIICWGAYGPILHKGQAAMSHSRLRPLLCVGLSYFAIAVVVPQVLLSGAMEEASSFMANAGTGTLWSLAAGAAGAVGALGIILAFNFGGKPIYVMPLVFGGAPVVNTLEALWARGGFAGVSPVTLGGFFAGLLLVISGAALVLVFAPKGAPPKKVVAAESETKPKSDATPEVAAASGDKPAT